MITTFLKHTTFALLLTTPFPCTTLAQELESMSVIDAYRKGHEDGYNKAKQEYLTNIFASPYDGGTITGVGAGTAYNKSGYELPNSFIEQNGGDEPINFQIPDNWFVGPSTSGDAVYAKVLEDGRVLPFTRDSSGTIETLDPSQAPIWTADEKVKRFFNSLPKAEGGMTYIPVQPRGVE